MRSSLTLWLEPNLLRRIKDRAIMNGNSPEQETIGLIKRAMGMWPERSASEKQLMVLNKAIERKQREG